VCCDVLSILPPWLFYSFSNREVSLGKCLLGFKRSLQGMQKIYMEENQKKKFYGTIEIHFQNGIIQRVKKHETILVADPQNLKQD
jgi:hypothetical protein